MAEADKLNIDSIIQRLLEGKSKDLSIFIWQGSHFSSQARQRYPRNTVLDRDEFVFEWPSRLQIASSSLQNSLHSPLITLYVYAKTDSKLS